MELEQKIEAVLFYKAEPMKKAALARLFETDPEHIDEALRSLHERLKGRGVALIETETDIELSTAPELSETIESFRKDELRRDIGKAGAETLAIILYRGPVSRSEIDSIRGVNSTFILRNLMVRGLIERRPHPRDQRSYQYAITTELLAHLGVRKREELPEFSDIMTALEQYETFAEGQQKAHVETEES